MPNYGILQNYQSAQQGSPILEALSQGIDAFHKTRQSGEESALRKKQAEAADVTIATNKEELENRPKLRQREEEQHKANLAQIQQNMAATRASIDAQQQNIAASRQGMQTESLRQKALQFDLSSKMHDSVNKLTEAVLNAPADQRPMIYKKALETAEKLGYDTAAFPREYTPDVDSLIQTTYQSSGRALNDLKQQAETAKLQKSLNPGNAILEELPKEQAKQLVKDQQAAASAAEVANRFGAKLDAFEGIMKSIPLETGAKYTIPFSKYLSPQAQQLSSLTDDITVDKLALATGTQTDRDARMYANSAVNISNSPGANRAILERDRAAMKRAQQKPIFIQTMIDRGIYDPAKINSQWIKFIDENPLFNYKTGAPIQEHIGNWQSYVPTSTAVQRTDAQVQAGGIVQGADGKQYRKVNGGYEEV
jgi:hypothetical protein